MNDRPWMTALEMQFAALRFADVVNRQQTNSVKLNKMCRFAAPILRKATAYSWSRMTQGAVALASKTIPNDSFFTPELLPSSECWWWFDGGTPYSAQAGSQTFEVIALLMIKGVLGDQPGIAFMTFAKPLEENVPPVPSTYWTWRFGESYEDMTIRIEQLRDGEDQTWVHARHLSRFAIAGCGWLNQRILSISSGAVERHRRKQISREYSVPLPSDVNVIQLRRTESQSRAQSSGGERVDWSCRWIVNGHWRNQPYKDERKLIYIMPFVKGPEDKPLKVPSHTVYQVSR